MPENVQDQSREEDLRRLLTDAIEVQLAALKAGISFWTEWIEQTGEFVNSATKTLASINSEDQQTKDVLLELVDAGRASMRSMTEIPRHSAQRFIDELDRLKEEQEAEAAAKKATKATATPAKKATKATGAAAAAKGAGAARGAGAAKGARASGAAVKQATKSAARKGSAKRPRRAGRVKS